MIQKLILFILLLPSVLVAMQVDEDQLFSDSETVVKNNYAEKQFEDTMDKRSIGISGQILAVALYSQIDETSPNYIAANKPLVPYMLGDIYLDARLPGGYKGFGSFELIHDSSTGGDDDKKQTTVSARELFVDFNIARHLYLRAGKQVLQWGRCYLWNPTDTINIEKKSFLNKLENREGTDGLKAHIPFGTAVNLYGFADLTGASETSSIAAAGKFEFLISGTEMALSAWGKREYHPVYGYELSTRILGIDVKGEASYSRGSNSQKVVNSGATLTLSSDDETNIYRGSINLARDFDFGDKAKSLNFSFEFFYNGDGYSGNPLEDRGTYMFDNPVNIEINNTDVPIPAGSRKTYLLGNGLYEPNYFARYYSAIFITKREFFTSDLTLRLNGIANIKHRSYILSPGLSYTNINNFTSGITSYFFLGENSGEYRAMSGGTKFSVQVNAGVIF